MRKKEGLGLFIKNYGSYRIFIKKILIPPIQIFVKVFKDNFRFNYDSLNETFLVHAGLIAPQVRRANNLISFLNAELDLFTMMLRKKNDAFGFTLKKKEIDILSRDYIQNKIASSEVNLLTIMNDPNYILLF